MRLILASLVILTNLFSFNASLAGSNNATVFASAKILNSVSVVTKISEESSDAMAVAAGPDGYSIQVSVNGERKTDECTDYLCSTALAGDYAVKSVTVDVE